MSPLLIGNATMPRGRKKITPSESANGATDVAQISKTDAVRDALAVLGAGTGPVPIQEHVKKKFGLDISIAHIYTIKSGLNRQAKNGAAPKGKRKRGRPKGVKAAAPAAPAHATGNGAPPARRGKEINM